MIKKTILVLLLLTAIAQGVPLLGVADTVNFDIICPNDTSRLVAPDSVHVRVLYQAAGANAWTFSYRVAGSAGVCDSSVYIDTSTFAGTKYRKLICPVAILDNNNGNGAYHVAVYTWSQGKQFENVYDFMKVGGTAAAYDNFRDFADSTLFKDPGKAIADSVRDAIGDTLNATGGAVYLVQASQTAIADSVRDIIGDTLNATGGAVYVAQASQTAIADSARDVAGDSLNMVRTVNIKAADTVSFVINVGTLNTWDKGDYSLAGTGLNGVTQSSGSVIFSNTSIGTAGSVTNPVKINGGAVGSCTTLVNNAPIATPVDANLKQVNGVAVVDSSGHVAVSHVAGGVAGNVSGSVGSVASNVDINSNSDITNIKNQTDKIKFDADNNVGADIKPSDTLSRVEYVNDIRNNDTTFSSNAGLVTLPDSLLQQIHELYFRVGRFGFLDAAAKDSTLNYYMGRALALLFDIEDDSSGAGTGLDSAHTVEAVKGALAVTPVIPTDTTKSGEIIAVLSDTSHYQGAASGLTAEQIAAATMDSLREAGVAADSAGYTRTIAAVDSSESPDEAVTGLLIRVNNLAQNAAPYHRSTNNNGQAGIQLETGSYVIYTTDPRFEAVLDTITVAGIGTDTLFLAATVSNDEDTLTTGVCFVINKPNGVPYDSAVIRVELRAVNDSLLYVGDNIVLEEYKDVSKQVASNGVAVINLYPNSLFVNDSTYYRVQVFDRQRKPNKIVDEFKMRVIESDTPLAVKDLKRWR